VHLDLDTGRAQLPGEHREEGRLSAAVGAGDQQVLPAGDGEPLDADPTGHDEVAHPDRRRAGSECPAEAERTRRLGDLDPLDRLDPPLDVVDPAGHGPRDIRPLEAIDVLVVVAWSPVVRHRPGGGLLGEPQGLELVALGEEGLLPTPSGSTPLRQVCREVTEEPRPTFAVEPEVRGVEVDDHGGGVVEEDPVVARDDDDSGRARDELLDEGHGHVVEVVRGLVEEDAIRSPRDDRSQGETGPLPAGERVDRSSAVEVAQPEVGGSEVGPATGSPGVVGLGPGELAGILLLHRGVTRA